MQASQKPDFVRCYRILSLKVGCSWDQARRHYKLLSQRWHPDRHPHDPSVRASAEKKQRAINLAMRTITDYYKTHGRMPLGARPEMRQPDLFGDDTENVQETGPGPQKARKSSKIWRILPGILVITFVTWILWPSSEEPPPASQVSASPMDTQSGQATSGIAWFGSGDTRGSLQQESKPISSQERSGDLFNQAETPTPLNSGSELIRIGSSYDDVLRIQGEPLFKTALRWDYGPSYIEFRYEKVSGWHSSPMRPLRVKKK